jgi:hypothetical protein
VTVKGKGHSRTGHEGLEGSRGIALLFLYLGATRRWVVHATPRPLYPRKNAPPYLLYRRLRGPHGPSGLVRKISPPQRFDPRTVRPLASRFTDCAIQAHITVCHLLQTFWRPMYLGLVFYSLTCSSIKQVPSLYLAPPFCLLLLHFLAQQVSIYRGRIVVIIMPLQECASPHPQICCQRHNVPISKHS